MISTLNFQLIMGAKSSKTHSQLSTLNFQFRTYILLTPLTIYNYFLLNFQHLFDKIGGWHNADGFVVVNDNHGVDFATG